MVSNITKFINKIKCCIGKHQLQVVKKEGLKELYLCKACHREFSSCYDMTNGNTYFINYNLWFDKH